MSAWIAYERVAGPLGPERADIHAAIVASTIANANRGKGKRPFKPEDFVPQWDDPKRWTEQTQDHLEIVKALNRAFGGQTRERGTDSVDAAGPGGEGGRRRPRRREGRK